MIFSEKFKALLQIVITLTMILAPQFVVAQKQIFTLDDKNIYTLIQNQSLNYKEIKNKSLSFDLTYQTALLPYNWTGTLDLSRENDKTASVSTLLQPNSTKDKFTGLLSKKWLTGTTATLELTDILWTAETSPSRYFQNYFQISLEQNIFPTFWGSPDLTQIKSYEADLHRNELQNIFDLNDFTRDTVALYWKAKAISVSVRENRDLFNKYESLIKTIQKKKNNNYATAGELEQALAEFEARKQSWKEDENTLNNYLSQLKSFLNLPPESEIQITLENSPQSLPEKNSITIENLKKYQLQKLKTDSAQLNAEASEFKGYPRLSLYSRYLQQGLDNQSSSRAWTDLRDDATNKYAIGLKLDYTFDDQASTKDRQYKQITAQIETDRLNRFKEDLSLQVKNSREKLENSYQNIQSTQTILKYRIEAVKQIAVNYSQGRTDISFLIDAYNKKITAEVNAVNAYGQYVQNLMDYQSLVL